MIQPLQILLIAFMISTLTNIIDILNISTGEFKKQIKGKAVFSFLLIGLCSLVVKSGINAVAFAILAYHIAFLIFSFYLSKTRLKISWTFLINAITPATIYSAIMFIFVKILAVFIFYENNFTSLFCLSISGAVTYFICFFASDFEQTLFIKEELNSSIKKIWDKIL